MDGRFLFPLPLVLQTFAAYSFCLLLYLHLRQYRFRSRAWGGWAWRLLGLLFALIYVCHLSGSLALLASDGFVSDQPRASAVMLQMAMPLIGPLLMQVFYTTERDLLPRPAVWAAIVIASWTAAVWLSGVAGFDSLYAQDNIGQPRIAGSDILLAFSGLFSTAVVLVTRRPEDSPFRRNLTRWRLGLACTLELLLLGRAIFESAWLGLFLGHLPVLFMLVTVYYGERFMFWDVFAKRGLFFSVVLLTLTGHIVLLGHFLDLAILEFARSWIFSLSLLPLVAAAPWAHSRLDRWIDRAVLRRHYTPVDAVQRFGESLQAASHRRDLLQRAEASLSEIFRSIARVEEGPEVRGEGITAKLDVNGSPWGLIRVLPRADEIPFLSEDCQLLSLLSRTFGIALENDDLRDQNSRRQQREQELALLAVRSELKALRAQINPHFLFNALNTVAALIPRHPQRAEQVVEQLSEVFRYAVRHSEREWVRLEEELLVVNAYLDIECARFGDRLRVEAEIDDAARELQIPAMVIQTLAENAIKHGIAAIRGPGRIAIAVSCEDDCVSVRVQDSGPGFPPGITHDRLPDSARSGYGLRNVRERLSTYFGSEARMIFSRGEGHTQVELRIPFRKEETTYACAHRG